MMKIECTPSEIEVPEPEFPSREMWSVMAAKWDDFKQFYGPDITEHSTNKLGLSHRHMHLRRGGKVLGVAHLDSVQKCTHFAMDRHNENLFCPTIDNRLGAWVILHGLRRMGVVLDVLLCDEEERGNSTAQDFKLPDGVEYNWMVSFDRMNDDCALYQYEDQWDKEVLKSFGINGTHGSYSDIASAGHLGVLGMNMGCGMKDYHSTSAWCNMKELATQMKRFARFHKVYGETKLPFTPPKWGSGRTRTYVYKPGVTSSHDDEYWDKWLEESWKKEADRRHNGKPSFPVQDTNRLEALYAIFMLKGMKNSYFEAMHPVKWCAEHAQERPSSQLAANIRNLVECYRCHRYFEMDDTELLYATGEEYCKYCYLTAAEMLGMLDRDWYELATTIL